MESAAPVFPEPTASSTSRAEVLLRYLDYFRETVVHRVTALGEHGARNSVVPSGWTPLQLAVHLTQVERRWLVWGFEGRDIGDPWADERNGRWHAPPERSLTEVLTALRDQGRVSRAVVEAHDLAEVGAPGDRWDGAPPATLERVLLHLFQEYARHAGQLDVVSELAGGPVGE